MRKIMPLYFSRYSYSLFRYFRIINIMLDIKFIKENPDLIKEAVRKKHVKFDVDELLKVEEERTQNLLLVENLRAEQNKVTEKISQTTDKVAREQLIDEMRTFKEHLKEKEAKLEGVMKKWRDLMIQAPNVPDMSVPEGADETANQEIKRWGDIPTFSFKPKDHIELMEKLDLVDLERGVKVSGFRGYFLKNEAALLSFAIWQYAMDALVTKGFFPLIVPSRVKKEVLLGTGYLPHGEDDLFKTQDDDYLAGTGEVGTMGYFMNDVIAGTDLPIKIAAFSPCFRREAGSYGKDVKGLIRVHEFFKVEQLILCEASHEESVKWHEELTKNAEELLQALKLPYRIVTLCGGEMGKPHVKTYDIETWIPSEGKYRETHSSSYYHDFQTRRLGIKYKDAEGKTKYAHSLNNTAIATPRIIAAIIENYQQADGSIAVPEVLKKYIGKDVIK